LLQGVIDAALIPRPPQEVLVKAFGLSIKRHDMHTLADLNWLNDEVSWHFFDGNTVKCHYNKNVLSDN
jgi:hypothetical protein